MQRHAILTNTVSGLRSPKSRTPFFHQLIPPIISSKIAKTLDISRARTPEVWPEQKVRVFLQINPITLIILSLRLEIDSSLSF
ncbi:hypothetical protein SAMN05444392_11845 [Seinonella peptonophila]|uniref:Uncharacterized protein n=1 Tax=Seinonella peptonophila TaxID=112248 RepID=A0A1M5B5N8_9BACL|nr:hypothetical protein SAMN05444392_11845 [Seinonella peptonophila]